MSGGGCQSIAAIGGKGQKQLRTTQSQGLVYETSCSSDVSLITQHSPEAEKSRLGKEGDPLRITLVDEVQLGAW